MQGRSYTIDICNGPLARNIVAFALSLMAANVLQLMFNLADVVVVRARAKRKFAAEAEAVP